jgi:hypothetical protein
MRPALVTEATVGAEEAHVTDRPVRVIPRASRVVAVSCSVLSMYTAPVPGVMLTVATGTAVTVMDAVAVFPSTVAVAVVVPGDTAVTSPCVEMLAMEGAAVAQVTGRPVSVPPALSRALAVSCCVAPVSTLTVAGVTLTVATGTGWTVMLAVPLLPSLVAVIVAVPEATPVTTPVLLTAAMVGVLLLHEMLRPVSGAPDASRVAAVRGVVAPIRTVALVGATTTLATGTGVTVTVAVPVMPSTVAEMVADPGATAVTSPEAETVAVALADDVQVVVRPLNALPLASFATAVSCWVPPTTSDADPGVTSTVATLAGAGGVVGVVGVLLLPPSDPPPQAATMRTNTAARIGTRIRLRIAAPPPEVTGSRHGPA